MKNHRKNIEKLGTKESRRKKLLAEKMSKQWKENQKSGKKERFI